MDFPVWALLFQLDLTVASDDLKFIGSPSSQKN